MKALVYNGPGLRSWEEKPDPEIQEPTDVIVRIDSATICGTDLHILKGDVPEVRPGTILGPGDTIAIVGAGPIGLATVLTAKLYTPGRMIAIDLADSRLEKALELGADVTINSVREDALARVMELTGGLGADVAVEAVGLP